MKAKLVAVRSRGAKQTLVLEELPVVVGREPDADICLEDSWVSRQHCQFGESDGSLTVRDLDSRNGTFVNGCRVSDTELAPGDVLTIGTASFQVQYRRGRVKPAVNGGRRPLPFLQRFGFPSSYREPMSGLW